MDWIIRGRKELSCSYMEAGAAFLGEDILACIQGGDKPHIGCTVQAVPRPSLTGNGTISATSSILNLTGHKDEALCRRLAEKLCRETGRVVVCTGGFHIDNMKPEQIDEVVKAWTGWRMRLCRGLLGQDTGAFKRR